ncbi:MAG: hypothetical protein MO847_10690 [Candidatus Protistobacter heckmanni]|nr:hypothetical protein [Candidatus Protistobacter heckmanni]
MPDMPWPLVPPASPKASVAAYELSPARGPAAALAGAVLPPAAPGLALFSAALAALRRWSKTGS